MYQHHAEIMTQRTHLVTDCSTSFIWFWSFNISCWISDCWVLQAQACTEKAAICNTFSSNYFNL